MSVESTKNVAKALGITVEEASKFSALELTLYRWFLATGHQNSLMAGADSEARTKALNDLAAQSRRLKSASADNIKSDSSTRMADFEPIDPSHNPDSPAFGGDPIELSQLPPEEGGSKGLRPDNIFNDPAAKWRRDLARSRFPISSIDLASAMGDLDHDLKPLKGVEEISNPLKFAEDFKRRMEEKKARENALKEMFEIDEKNENAFNLGNIKNRPGGVRGMLDKSMRRTLIRKPERMYYKHPAYL